jgi:hypothetical protein
MSRFNVSKYEILHLAGSASNQKSWVHNNPYTKIVIQLRYENPPSKRIPTDRKHNHVPFLCSYPLNLVISSALIVDWCDEMVLEDSAHSAKVPPPNNLRLNEGEIEHLAPRMMLNVYWIYFTIIHHLSGNANRASG